MKNGDGFVLLLLLIVFAIWGWFLLKRWWNSLPDRKMAIEADEEIPVTEAVALLENAGYEVMTLKRRIPLYIRVDGGTDAGGEDMESRLFIDHWARCDDELYLIKVERERQPYEWTGSGLRDRLLPYALLYEDAAGIVVVNPLTGRIRKVEFEIDR
ncbi:hypothetical protein [Gorillibacterium timonense]|uniref:hypothetical protein n=1 Tax=Gorillibacterium timonense TaxID=1689269 RepID=UPI00071C78C1|nr:hypothetical protein [Gorillibacterium timonense]